MPQYTFKCEDCGEYEVWKSMTDDLKKDCCPECRSVTTRIFTLFNVSQMDAGLVKRIDGGTTPKVVKKEHLPKSNMRKKEKNPRPWMV